MTMDGLTLLRTRASIGPKHLTEPGPDDAQLRLMLEAALHAPDHGELVPYRFKVVAGAARHDMSRLFGEAARRAGKDEAGIAMDEERALLPPVTVAVVARQDLGHQQVPAHEQWIALGGALANFLTAAHALGFGGKMLSGAKARDPGLVAAFCEPGETLVGWIALGTPAKAPKPRAAKTGGEAALVHWAAP